MTEGWLSPRVRALIVEWAVQHLPELNEAWEQCRAVVDEGEKFGPMSPGERRLVRLTFVNPLAPGPHGLALTLTRRPDYKGEGLLTLDHMDAAAAFESLGGGVKRNVRGKVYVAVKAEVVAEAKATNVPTCHRPLL